MSHHLIIVAHPNPQGFAHRLAQTYRDTVAARGHEVRIIDLYDPQYRQEYLVLDDKNKPTDDPVFAVMREHIQWADELVFCYPLWWFDGPAILKNWYDVNYRSGYAYKYRKNRPLPHQLLKGKSATYLVTTGGQWYVYWTVGLAIMLVTWLGRCLYVGIRLRRWMRFTDMHARRSVAQREKMLERVRGF